MVTKVNNWVLEKVAEGSNCRSPIPQTSTIRSIEPHGRATVDNKAQSFVETLLVCGHEINFFDSTRTGMG